MSVKQFNTRIINKIDTVSNLNSNTFIPLKGEITIGTVKTANLAENPYIFKIGDGSTNWMGLPSIGPNSFKWGKMALSSDGTQLKGTLAGDAKTYMMLETNPASDIACKLVLTLESGYEKYFYSENYVFISNKSTTRTVEINAIFIGSGSTEIEDSHIYTQIDGSRLIITPGECCQISVSIWPGTSDNGSTFFPCATVVANTSFTNGGTF